MESRLKEIDIEILEFYKNYKTIYSNLAQVTQEITKLENERNGILEKDGRKFMFRKPAVELRSFLNILKTETWTNVEYENFDENKKDYINDSAMIVDVFCSQINYAAPVRFILVLSGYLSKEEYEVLNNKFNMRLPEYYIKE